MSEDSYIGFQSNGMLVTRDKAAFLINAGLNLVCISMDASVSDTFSSMRKGGDITSAENAIMFYREAGIKLKKNLRMGIEFVMTRDNIHQLVPVLKTAAAKGIDFAIVTHLIAYDKKMTLKAAFDHNTDRAVALYEKTRKEAANKGIDITKYFNIKWKFNHTHEEERIVNTVDKMMMTAQDEGIFLHLKNVMNRDVDITETVINIFREAESFAAEAGIELFLPAVNPRALKKCDFIESGSVFISWNGDVHPCHFLWHKYQCYVSGWKKYVTPLVFGNLNEKSLHAIWNDPEYVKFRNTVSGYNYPLCSNCGFAPCDYIYSEKFEQDCYTNTIPCCDCQWCLGIFQCLR
jgi:putative metalloenzyme radical SAM/SPASM domain maturase